jgi:hypothetical protein
VSNPIGPPPGQRSHKTTNGITLTPPGHALSRRDLAVYDRIGQALAAETPS